MNDSYDQVAEEYYNEVLHPTSDDFGFASYQLLRRNKNLFSQVESVCEVGAGKSALLKVIAEEAVAVPRLMVTDKSAAMLKYSRDKYPGAAEFVVCDATQVPAEDSSFDLVVSLLGDPYNSRSLWLELNRLLKVAGNAFFTTPSWEWANEFRDHATNEKPGAALFQTKSAGTVYVPSQVFSEKSQRQLMEGAGFHVSAITRFTVHELISQRGSASRKISDYLSASTPIVTAFVATKVTSLGRSK